MKILLLEDELLLNNSIAEYLRDVGHIVRNFTDGQEVLDSIDKKDVYDLLILDINVPTKDGFEILKELNEKKNIYSNHFYISFN